MREYHRKIVNHELKLKGEIQGYCPVQGSGTVDNFPFYFRARHDQWSFAISEHPEIDPVDIQLIETGEQYGFFKEAKYGIEGGDLAGWMELSEAEKLIIECCVEYTKNRDSR
jgi:hypothetical protein